MPTSKANSITLNNDTEYDELYDEAVKFVTESNKSSIADIQKQFQIGYNRPSGLIEFYERMRCFK
jgi:DNA segregation ATPase FtsK/SpoIIIE, S-DNA-T family